MAVKVDRVGQLVEANRRNRRILLSPEGVPLDIQAASNGERLSAFALDILIMFGVILGLFILLLFMFQGYANASVGMTLILFLAFVVRNLYFIHFELAWQGRTPGKRVCNLRVINRAGGELTPSAIIARNLTREVEFFLPLSLVLTMSFHDGEAWQSLTLLGWVLAISCLPLFNKDHLRAGDLIAGTQVIAMPKRALLGDLSVTTPPVFSPVPAAGTTTAPVSTASAPRPAPGYVFTHEQLAVYGAFELQVLEEFLRRPATVNTQKLLVETCARICKKIGWTEPVPEQNVRRFLTDFYAAERAELERGQLFGRLKEDKNAGPGKPGEGK